MLLRQPGYLDLSAAGPLALRPILSNSATLLGGSATVCGGSLPLSAFIFLYYILKYSMKLSKMQGGNLFSKNLIQLIEIIIVKIPL